MNDPDIRIFLTGAALSGIVGNPSSGANNESDLAHYAVRVADAAMKQLAVPLQPTLELQSRLASAERTLEVCHLALSDCTGARVADALECIARYKECHGV